MGTLRVFLAACVISEHVGGVIPGISLLPGFLSVEIFYLFSGFYMGLILTEKYVRPGAWKIFYRNRALRLLPIYYCVLGVTLILCVVAVAVGAALPPWLRGYADWRNFGGATLALVSLPNLSLIGLDALHFFHVTADFGIAPSLLPGEALFDPNAAGRWFTLVPQAWSLGLELEFYLLAPLLVRRRTAWLIALFFASAAARAIFYRFGYTADPWSDRFFPFELALFVAGILAYRGYAALARLTERRTAVFAAVVKGLGRAAILAIVGAILLFSNIGRGRDFIALGHGPLINWMLVAGVAVLLPLLFLATRRSMLDNAVGQYSYPMYISHFVFIGFFASPLRASVFGYGFGVLLMTMIFSAVLVQASRGIEARRAREVALAPL